LSKFIALSVDFLGNIVAGVSRAFCKILALVSLLMSANWFLTDAYSMLHARYFLDANSVAVYSNYNHNDAIKLHIIFPQHNLNHSTSAN